MSKSPKTFAQFCPPLYFDCDDQLIRSILTHDEHIVPRKYVAVQGECSFETKTRADRRTVCAVAATEDPCTVSAWQRRELGLPRSSTGGSMHLVCAATGMLGIAMYESFHDSVRGPRTTDGVES